jgi:ribonuclease T1
MSLPRSLSVLALVLGLALPLSACGDGDGATTSDQRPATTTAPAGGTGGGTGGGGRSTAGDGATRSPVPRGAEGLDAIAVGDLPPEGQATLRLIAAGGPFPYRQDGVTFQNRERILPARGGGYYREYTVRTPGSPTRGARRIVVGRQPIERYYTADHYASFRLIVGPERP